MSGWGVLDELPEQQLVTRDALHRRDEEGEQVEAAAGTPLLLQELLERLVAALRVDRVQRLGVAVQVDGVELQRSCLLSLKNRAASALP